jgi:hypothetical protein
LFGGVVVSNGRALPLEARMQRSLLALWLISTIVYATSDASAQPVETASNPSEQVEVHSVVVDMPQIISLSLASPDSWGTLPSPVWMEDYPPATGQEAQAREYSSPSS